MMTREGSSRAGPVGLALLHCAACGRMWVPRIRSCPFCGQTVVDEVLASGYGQVYSWVVARYAFVPELADQVPYVILTVELEEGARIFGRLEGEDPSLLEPGLAVQVVKSDTADGQGVVFATVEPPTEMRG